MLLILPLLAFAGCINALKISPPYPSLTIRGASPPTLENYTVTYLRNLAIQLPEQCHKSFVGIQSYPEVKEVNATQCREICEWISTQNAMSGSDSRCRAFNMYVLFKNDINQGLQCALYDRKWDNTFATNNGTYDPWGRARSDRGDFSIGDQFEISNSFAYWSTMDLGDISCGAKSVMTTTSTVLASKTSITTSSSPSVSKIVGLLGPLGPLGGSGVISRMCSIVTGTTIRLTTLTLTGTTSATQCRGGLSTTSSTTKIPISSASNSSTTNAMAPITFKLNPRMLRSKGLPNWRSSGSVPGYGSLNAEDGDA